MIIFNHGDYQKRLEVVKHVEKYKSKLTQKQIVGRTKVTQFIATCKSKMSTGI